MKNDMLDSVTDHATVTRRFDLEKLATPFNDLANAIKTAAAGKKIVLLQNCGNFGDALIRYGTLKFFEDYKFNFLECDMGNRGSRIKALIMGATTRFVDPTLFVVSGSGAWADVCTVAQNFTLLQYKVSRSLFILPTTFQHYGLPASIPVFVRDKGESAHNVPHAKFCHDMAFYLAMINPDRVLPNRTAPSKRLGLMFRTDNEARGHGLANLPGNHDLSAQGTHMSDPVEFFRYIDQYESVLTDRLHITIGAAILGKQVYVVPGNYFKIREIFSASIDGVFENCTLVSDEQAADIAHQHST